MADFVLVVQGLTIYVKKISITEINRYYSQLERTFLLFHVKNKQFKKIMFINKISDFLAVTIFCNTYYSL